MAENDFFISKPTENIFKAAYQKYLPYWPLLLLLSAIIFPLTYIYLRSKPKIYVASAKALIKDPYKSPSEGKALEALNIFNEKKVVENEIVVLQSSSLMNEVVKQLGLYARVFNKGKVQTEELFGERSPVYFIAQDLSNIAYTGTHQLDVDWHGNFILLDGRKIAFGDNVLLGKNNYKVVPNEGYTKFMKGKNYFVAFNDVATSTAEILQSLTITPNSFQSSVVNLELKTSVPNKGIAVLNKLFDVYNSAGLKDKNITAANTLKFIEDRLLTVSHQLDSIETNIKDIKSSRNIVDLSSQASQYLDAVKTSEQKGSEIKMQLDAINNVDAYVSSKGNKPGTVPGLELINDPMLASLSNQLYEAEFDLDKQRSIAGEQSEAVKLSRDKVLRIKNDIKESIKNIKRNIESQNSIINNNISKNSSLLAQVPASELTLLETKRQQMVKNTIYNYLLQKREEIALSSAATSGDIRVLESGYSYGPISPKAKNYYLIAALICMALFVLFIQVKEHLNNRVLFRSEIEKELKIPIVGEISFTSDKRPILVGEGEHTIIAEQFRSLRTNINFMGLQEKQNVLLVTSCISGEGKSFISANIAACIALMGKKVGLLELDLRKPKLSKQFGLNTEPGITNYLLGRSSIDEITRPVPGEKFSIISSGTIPPNPAELVAKAEFAELMNTLKQKFDFLVLDTSPVGLVTDAFLLSKFADVNAFVVRHNFSPSSCLKLVKDIDEQKKMANTCIIFNGIKPRGFRLFKKRLGPGYGSSYGIEQNAAYGTKKGYYSKN